MFYQQLGFTALLSEPCMLTIRGIDLGQSSRKMSSGMRCKGLSLVPDSHGIRTQQTDFGGKIRKQRNLRRRFHPAIMVSTALDHKVSL